MKKQTALELISDDSPNGARAKLAARVGAKKAENYFLIAGMWEAAMFAGSDTDFSWTVVAVRKDRLELDVEGFGEASYAIAMVDTNDFNVSHGRAHQSKQIPGNPWLWEYA